MSAPQRPPVRPKKSLGQHFLYDRHHLERIAEAAALSPQDVVLEIGPGTGSLTAILLERAGHVIAVEIDGELVNYLRERFAGVKHLTLVHADILKVEPGRLVAEHCGAGRPYKVVANLPYYITSAVLRHLLEAQPPPALVVVTVQEEVAQRICATPPRMSLLAVSVQFYGRPRMVHRIPRGAFRPVPEVDSAVVRIDVYPEPPVDVPSRQTFFQVVKAGFSQPRKQLRNALSTGLGVPRNVAAALLEEAGIAPHRRAETLTLEEWARLAWAYHRWRGSQPEQASE